MTKRRQRADVDIILDDVLEELEGCMGKLDRILVLGGLTDFHYTNLEDVRRLLSEEHAYVGQAIDERTRLAAGAKEEDL